MKTQNFIPIYDCTVFPFGYVKLTQSVFYNDEDSNIWLYGQIINCLGDETPSPIKEKRKTVFSGFVLTKRHLFKFIRKYNKDVKEFQKVIDDNNELIHVTPIAISSIDAGKFADIYFNRKSSYSKVKADDLALLTNYVREIVSLIEEIILIINKTKSPDYFYGKSKDTKAKRKKKMSRIKTTNKRTK